MNTPRTPETVSTGATTGHLFLSDLQPRCGSCNKLLAEKLTRPWTIRCHRCKTLNSAPDPGFARNLVVERGAGEDGADIVEPDN